MILESDWVPVIGNRNVAANQSNFHSEMFRPSQPLVGPFYEDWYSPSKENLPLSFNIYLGPIHTFELLVDEPSILSQAEKIITVFKAQQIHKMTSFDRLTAF